LKGDGMGIFKLIKRIFLLLGRKLSHEYREKMFCILVTLFFIIRLGTSASGSTLVPITERQLVLNAELIFEGVVQNVEYRFSDRSSKRKNKVPHTFVTFEVKKLLKGKTVDKNLITLRFVGGPYDKSKLLVVDGIPLFDLGDRDILFVAGNGIRICPLVGWSQGRFRIIKNRVFTDDGREVQLSDKNELGYGKPQELEEMKTDRVGIQLLRRAFSDEKNEEGKQIISPKKPVSSLSYEKFVAFISQLINNYYTPSELKKIEPVKSTDIKEEFSFRLTPVHAPVTSLEDIKRKTSQKIKRVR
jgi:hypothetical protein